MSEASEKLPVMEIKPGRAWLNFELKELWMYRELAYFLTWREIMIRYKQTAIGVLWAILQPLLTTIIFTAIFSQFAKFDKEDFPYPVFAMTGLLIWLFFNSAVSVSSIILISNTSLVTKVYIPRVIMPLSAVCSCLVDFLIGVCILGAMLIFYGIHISWQIIFAPIFVVMAFFFALGVGIFFSALNVRFRDVKHALPFALQLWMFLTPVFYPIEMLPDKWRWVFALNPIYGILQGFRASLLGGLFHWRAIAFSAVMIILILILSMMFFKKMEEDFADII